MWPALHLTESLMIMSETPQTLPDRVLRNQDGQPVSLRDSLGRFVVIYFYPKAMTPGCTTQACLIRDAPARPNEQQVVTFGISPDAPQALKKFQIRDSLPFDLLSDSDTQLAQSFGSWVEKRMYGRTFMGMQRDLFVFAPDGALIGEYRKIAPSEHVKLVDECISAYKS